MAFLCLLSCYVTQAKIYTAVVEVPGATKAQLYQRALSFFNNSFKSSKEVIQNSDKEEGKIFGNGVIDYGGINTISFSIEVAVKDGKFKYVFSGFDHTGYTEGGVRNAGSLDNEKPDCGYFRMTKGYWAKIKNYTNKKVEETIESMKMYMAGEIDKAVGGGEDW